MGSDLVLVPDVHLEPGEPYDPSWIAVKRFIEDMKPTAIGLLGDFMDMDCFNRHNKHKPLLRELKRYWHTAQMCYSELDWLASQCDELYYTLGNHEDWLYQYLEEHPEMVETIDWGEDAGLDEYCTGWVRYGQYITWHKVNMTHGWKTTKYHAAATAAEFGDHIFYAHTHDHQEFTPHFRKDQEPYAAVSCGCVCSRNPSYMRKQLTSRWINGFVYLEDDENWNFNHHWLAITDGGFTFAGNYWHGR